MEEKGGGGGGKEITHTRKRTHAHARRTAWLRDASDDDTSALELWGKEGKKSGNKEEKKISPSTLLLELVGDVAPICLIDAKVNKQEEEGEGGVGREGGGGKDA